MMSESRKLKTVQNINILRIFAITLSILMIPFIAMKFTEEVRWELGDFIVMGSLLFGSGLSFEYFSKKFPKKRIIIGIGLLIMLLYVWAELAVGIFTNLGS